MRIADNKTFKTMMIAGAVSLLALAGAGFAATQDGTDQWKDWSYGYGVTEVRTSSNTQ